MSFEWLDPFMPGILTLINERGQNLAFLLPALPIGFVPHMKNINKKKNPACSSMVSTHRFSATAKDVENFGRESLDKVNPESSH